jgi:SnoaL-like domain/Aspartyl protease
MWTGHFATGVLVMAAGLNMPARVAGQAAPTLAATRPSVATIPEEIPIERCDRLPMVKVRVGSVEMRFLVDTGATSMLNLKAFSGGRMKEIQVTSWSGTAATSAREISIPEFWLGSHRLRNLKLPAIDLSPIGNTCGGPVDGILGVDLLDQMAVTIDLKRQIASLGADSPDPKVLYADMENSMHSCTRAFEQGKAAEFAECLDPEIVFYTPHGEFIGRQQVLGYLGDRYFRYAPDLRYRMNLHQVQAFGNALWYSYDYSIDTPKDHLDGHGFAMCRRNGTRWRMLNLHNSLVADSRKQNPEP